MVFLRLWGNTDALQSARSALARGDSPRVHAQVRSGAPTAQAGTGALVPRVPTVPAAATRAPLARSSSRRGQCHAAPAVRVGSRKEEREGGRERGRNTGRQGKLKKESEGQGEGGKGREEGPRLGSEALACPVPGARCPAGPLWAPPHSHDDAPRRPLVEEPAPFHHANSSDSRSLGVPGKDSVLEKNVEDSEVFSQAEQSYLFGVRRSIIMFASRTLPLG